MGESAAVTSETACSGIRCDGFQGGACVLWGKNVDHHAGTAFKAGLGDQIWPDVHVPVVLACVLMGGGMKAKVERHIVEHGIELFKSVAQCDADRYEAVVVRVLQMRLMSARDDEELVR